MNGLILEEIGSYPGYRKNIKEHNEDKLTRVRLSASGLNHRDVWIAQGKYPGIKTLVIPGSDGAGMVEGREVIINPNIGWGPSEQYQNASYQILGMPTNGTFAEYVYVAADRLHDMPLHLSIEEAAALPLNGLTAYRAVFTRGKVEAESSVLIHGVGGGVALMALQFCQAIGAKVYVTSSSRVKIDKAVDMGAIGGVLYTDNDWIDQLGQLSGGIDIVIDGAAGDGVGQLIKICNLGSRYVMYGGTRGKINDLSPQLMFWKQMTFHGTTMGSDREFEAMLDFVGYHKIKPVIDSIIPLSEAHRGFERMEHGLQFGKIIFLNGQ